MTASTTVLSVATIFTPPLQKKILPGNGLNSLLVLT